MSEIVNEKEVIVNQAVVIGYNADGELRYHAPGIDPGRLLFMLEKIKLGLVASVEIRGEQRKVLPIGMLPGRNGAN